jgi:hypothetical protein
MVRSIDPRSETLRLVQWPNRSKVANLFGTRVAETILASVLVRAHQKAGHMNASDPTATLQTILQGGGRSLITPPLSIASFFLLLPSRGHGSLRGRKGPPQHLVRSTSAAMSTTGLHVLMRPKALLRNRLHPRPVGQLSHPRRRFGWISVNDPSGGHWLLGPAEWLARAPDAVHDHREFPGKRYACLACT